MQFRIIAVGNKLPDWVNAGFTAYAKRLPANFAVSLHEIHAAKRTKTSHIDKLIEKEGEKILEVCQPGNIVIALDVKGQTWTTKKLSEQMQVWHDENRSVDLIIGGPDGLSNACLQKANLKLSLSAFTFPHPLVRIMLAEQLYRGWTILQSHPYHRG